MDRINNNSSYEKETKLRKDKSKGSNVGGITLIALIITIIVMLILVAVTLVITLGENGIIAKAREAKNTQALRQEAEKSELGANAEDGFA